MWLPGVLGLKHVGFGAERSRWVLRLQHLQVGPWASRLVSEPVCASLKWDDSKHLRVVAGTQCGNSYSGLSTAVACGRRSVRVSDSFLFMAQLNSKFCDAASRNEVTTKSVPIVRAHRPHLAVRCLCSLILNSRIGEAPLWMVSPLPYVDRDHRVFFDLSL